MTRPRRRPELTVAEVAEAAGVSTDLVRQWIRRGRIQRNACGAVDGASVVRYLAARKMIGDEDDA